MRFYAEMFLKINLINLISNYYLNPLSLTSSDAQWETIPRCCCDPGCHVHLWGDCGQQCAQWGDVQIPGEQ